MRPRPPDDDAGFALITVLWAAVVLSLVTAGVIAMAQTAATVAHGREQRARAVDVADAAINLVLLDLLEPGRQQRVPTDGTSFSRQVLGQTVRVAVQDEIGKIDLNAASPEVLRQLLESAGLDPAAADAMADKILDWREYGVGKRLNGAKAEDYHAAGYRYGPRQGPFATVDELKLVMGMSQALFDKMAPCLTVYSQSSMVDQTVAPRQVLLVLSGMDEDAVDHMLDARAARLVGDDAAGIAAVGAANFNPIGHALTVSATVVGHGRHGVTRTVVVRLTGQARDPIWIYRWN